MLKLESARCFSKWRVQTLTQAFAVVSLLGCSGPGETPPIQSAATLGTTPAELTGSPAMPAELEPAPPASHDLHPTTEEGIMQRFSQAIELRDLNRLRAILAPEMAADLTRLHDLNPSEFWRRGSIWSEHAATGMAIVMRAEDAFQVPRWRALVRFGNGWEETVEFALIEGRLLLAEP